jgi:glyoxylase-like metal-dependent hydrolase (beta-lactamase superfamily II)
MVPEASPNISRRQFLTAGGLTVATACFAPGYVIAETGGLVGGAFKEAAAAKITIQNLRRNISVLLGAGGNIAVLTGPDGKVLIDAEIVTARPHVSEALASINGDPIKQLINTHWHFDHTGGNEWVMKPEPVSWRTRTRANIFPRLRASKATGSTLSQPRRPVRFPPPSSKTNTLYTSTIRL